MSADQAAELIKLLHSIDWTLTIMAGALGALIGLFIFKK